MTIPNISGKNLLIVFLVVKNILIYFFQNIEVKKLNTGFLRVYLLFIIINCIWFYDMIFIRSEFTPERNRINVMTAELSLQEMIISRSTSISTKILKEWAFIKEENCPYRVNKQDAVCPGSSDPFYVVTCYIKWVTTSWTYGIIGFKNAYAFEPICFNSKYRLR